MAKFLFLRATEPMQRSQAAVFTRFNVIGLVHVICIF